MKDKGEFKTRYKMKVIVDGKIDKIIKSHDREYIFKQKKIIRKEYNPDGISDGKGRGAWYKDPKSPVVAFEIVASNVIKTAKPRYRDFKNLPVDTFHYGVNSDNEYYAANEDYSKIVKLIESH